MEGLEEEGCGPCSNVDVNAVVAEWAKLKLIGRPLLSSMASSSGVLWLAIRPSPCLLHIYRCHRHVPNLHEVIRFPEDPTFLLIAPRPPPQQQQQQPPQQSLDNDGNPHSTTPTTEASLLAITCDGCIWQIPLLSESSFNSRHRCTKRLKHNHSRGISNVCARLTTTASGSAQKGKGEDDWNIFEDCDIYKDIDLYPTESPQIGVGAASMNKGVLFKSLKLYSHGELLQRPEVKNIAADMLMGKFPDAHLVAVGPKNLAAVVSPSSGPVLFIGNPKAIISLTQRGLSNSSIYGKSSCLLFLACSKYKSLWCGPCLSEPLFNAFCPFNAGVKTEILLLQGNIDGLVYVFPIQHKNQILLPPTVLCNLKEPICGLVAATLFEGRDALFVFSSLGRIAVIITSKPGYTRDSSLGLKSELINLFQVDLKADIAIHDWRVPGPVISPMLIGSDCLCFCSASKICLVDLREIKPMLDYATQGIGISQKKTMKRSLSYNITPIDDVIIAVSGMGSSSLSRTVFALTSRGRLVALDISGQFLTTRKTVITSRKLNKSWKFVAQNREENAKDLIDEIAAVEAHTEAVQATMKYVNCAMNELSLALQFAYSVLSCKNRLTMQLPQQPAVSSFAGLRCNLEVRPLVLSVPEQRLRFGPPLQNCASDDGNESIVDYKLHVKLILYNHTPYPISSFWTVMLELQRLEKTGQMSKTCFSSIINDGYGLASGASSVIDFDIVCAENCVSPMKASVFLFHLNEQHNDVIQESHMINSRKPIMSHSGRNVSCCSMEQFNSVSNNGFMAAGAVGIMIARFRLDIMCLLREPKGLQDLSVNKSSSPMLSSVRLMPDGSDTSRTFSVKFELRDRRKNSQTSLPALDCMEKWKECFLEDLIHFCKSSVGGEELIGCDPNGNRVIFNLDGRHIDKPGLLLEEVQITADSLVLGCMVRESVLWRFQKGQDECKRMVPIKGDIVQYMDGTLSSLLGAQRRLDAIICDMENVNNLLQLSDSSKQSFEHMIGALEYIVDIYKSYREAAPWGPL